MPKRIRTYHLYTRCDEGREPKTWVSVPEEDADGHVIGDTTKLVKKLGYRRGALIHTCYRYKDLTAHAEKLAKLIGMPKSRIWDIFDWSEG